jgi:putative ABC transport system permease protein
MDVRTEVGSAVRALRRAPQFAAAAVLLLALGIGANVVLFSLADAVMLRPFPFVEQNRLVIGAEHLNATRAEVSYANFRDWRARSRSFKGLAAIGSSNWTLTLRDADPIAVPYRAVSSEFFDVLGVSAALGRTFQATDDTRAASRVVVISYGLWQRQFGADPHIVGRSIVLSERAFTIVGVMPREFTYPAGADLWAPLVPELADIRGPSLPDFVEGREVSVLHVIGRLNPSTDLGQARADLDRVIRELAVEHGRGTSATAELTPLVDDLLGSVKIGLWTLLAAVGLLLVAATANVAGLMLVQLSRRRREFTIRLALGASSSDLARQLFFESVLVVMAATVAAIAIAHLSLRVALSFMSQVLPRVDTATIDRRVVFFTIVLGCLTAVACWLAPALGIRAHGVEGTLRSGGRTVAVGGFDRPARKLMVAIEIGVAVVVLMGAGLLYRSVSRLGHLDLGFNPERLMAVELGLPPQVAGGTRADVYQFYSRAIDAVSTVPFVQSVAAVSGRPLKGPIGLDSAWQIEGQSLEVAEHNPWVNLETITPQYFATIGTPLIEGRLFDDHDRASTEPVVIVNEKLARWAWPGQSAIGKRLRASGLDVGRSPEPWWTVVGVVANIRYRELGAIPLDVYGAFQQSWFSVGDLMIRTSAPPATLVAAIRARLRQVSPDVIDVALMEGVVDAHESPWKTNLLLFEVFAGLTVLLAVVGLYATLAFAVSERSREIGIRLALGASGENIVRNVLMDGTRIAIPGALVGTLVCALGSRFVGAMLFEVSPLDPLTLAAVVGTVFTAALFACAVPAWRAARVDPAVCLRSE